ncbi:hypothetical protein KM043_013573 [Ampulex compressa]|nr:hypothetical protein KM043_013573 [Ampulex compressa]
MVCEKKGGVCVTRASCRIKAASASALVQKDGYLDGYAFPLVLMSDTLYVYARIARGNPLGFYAAPTNQLKSLVNGTRK